MEREVVMPMSTMAIANTNGSGKGSRVLPGALRTAPRAAACNRGRWLVPTLRKRGRAQPRAAINFWPVGPLSPCLKAASTNSAPSSSSSWSSRESNYIIARLEVIVGTTVSALSVSAKMKQTRQSRSRVYWARAGAMTVNVSASVLHGTTVTSR